jgi:hypothetical protein
MTQAFEISPQLRALLTNLVIPSVKFGSSTLQEYGLVALGLYCLMSKVSIYPDLLKLI